MAQAEVTVAEQLVLDAEELTQIGDLVRSAIGFDATRGDLVEVKNMPFTAPVIADADTGYLFRRMV